MIRSARFASSEALTLGIEEEWFVVDASGALRHDAIEQLGLLQPATDSSGEVKAELFGCQIEAATRVCTSIGELEETASALRATAAQRVDAAGLHLLAAGTHPQADPRAATITPRDDMLALADRHRAGSQLEQQLTCGLHVHVGMPSLETCLLALDQLASLAPILIALGAASPWWAGSSTGYASTRTELQRRNVLGGAPPPVFDETSYHAARAQLALIDPQRTEPRFGWDIAPVEHLGTVELRLLDAQPDAARSIALAALVQCICWHAIEGRPLVEGTGVLEPARRHGRWAASMHALGAGVIGPDGSAGSARHHALRLLELCAGAASELGSTRHLTWLAANPEPPAASLAATYAADLSA